MRLAQADPDPVETTEEVQEGALRLWESFLEALPRLGVAVTFIVAGWVVASLVRWALRRYWCRHHTESFAQVMSKLVSWALLGGFVLAAVTLTFPSVKPVDLLAGLGFFSIAVGFAFQDVLENSLSGVLLLFRQPFRSGDQIEVGEQQGTVETITIRETRITTFDGRLVIIPNRDVYKNAIVVQTANERRRISFVVGIAYESDLDEARSVVTQALRGIDSVDRERPPEALITELASSTVTIEARFWTSPAQHDVVVARSEAIAAVKAALDDAGIEMPSGIVALQATDSFAGALRGEELTPGGSVAA